LFVPFRFFTLLSHFKFFTPFATMIKVFYRMTSQLLVFMLIGGIIILTWTLGIYFFFAPYVYNFRNYQSSLIAVILYNFWEEQDYRYMMSNSPHRFIFIGAVCIIIVARYTALVLVVTLGVFIFKNAAAFEKLDTVTPNQKQQIDTMSEIQETVEKLYTFKKEELKLNEKKYGSNQNKKIIG